MPERTLYAYTHEVGLFKQIATIVINIKRKMSFISFKPFEESDADSDSEEEVRNNFHLINEGIAKNRISKYSYVNEVYMLCQEHRVQVSKRLQELIISYMTERWQWEGNIVVLKRLTKDERKRVWKPLRDRKERTSGEAFEELMWRYEREEPGVWCRWRRDLKTRKKSLKIALAVVVEELKELLIYVMQMAKDVNSHIVEIEGVV